MPPDSKTENTPPPHFRPLRCGVSNPGLVSGRVAVLPEAWLAGGQAHHQAGHPDRRPTQVEAPPLFSVTGSGQILLIRGQ